jgi:hypothetical protein
VLLFTNQHDVTSFFFFVNCGRSYADGTSTENVDVPIKFIALSVTSLV